MVSCDLYSGYDGTAMKAFKSLEGYRYFESGWVRQVLVAAHNNFYILKSKVRSIMLPFTRLSAVS